MTDNLVFFDVDGTLTAKQSIWSYLHEQIGKWEGAGEDNYAKFKRGEIDYRELCRLDAELFRGMRYSELKKIAYDVPKYDGLNTVFSYFTERGYTICLLSTGLKLITDYFTERYKIDHCFVNDLVTEEDICQGDAIINVWEDQKGTIVEHVMNAVKPNFVVAFGDSRGDLPVFNKADISISVNAKDADVLEAASYNFAGMDLAGICTSLDDQTGMISGKG